MEERKLIFRCNTGSTLYGLTTPESDVDYSSVIMPLPQDLLGLQPLEEIDNSTKTSGDKRRNDKDDIDDKQYTLPRYIHLLLNGNPEKTEMLFAEPKNILIDDPIIEFIRQNKEKAISQRVFHSFSGFAYAQKKKLIVKKERFGSLCEVVDWMEAHMQGRLEKDNKFTQMTEGEAEYLNATLKHYKSKDQAGATNSFHKGLPTGMVYETLKSERDNYGWRVRTESFKKLGIDCHTESTEFLTDSGWKKYSDITDSDLLGTIIPETGILEWQKFTDRGSYQYDGDIYINENMFTKSETTPNHRMLVSPCHRNIATNYSYAYDKDTAHWEFKTAQELDEGARSWFHTRTGFENNNPDYLVEDDYLILMGLYISEGSFSLRNGKLKEINICQTLKGKKEYFDQVYKIQEKYKLKETIFGRKDNIEFSWHTHDEIKYRIESECGLGSKNKKFPTWIHLLSRRQADILLHALYCGDGTMRKDCFVYYNTNYDVASGVQTIALLSGKNSNLRGPYHQTTTHGEVDMYQVYCSKAEAKPIAMNFNMAAKKSKKRILSGGNKKEYHGMVSCFTVPNSTLITRVDGKIAITGNCKFAYHIIRLLVECRQLLAHGKIFYPFQGDEYDQIMRIRRGEVEYQELLDMIETYEEAIAPLKEDNCLVKKPDFNFFNDWLVDTLIKHISGYRS